MIILWTIIVLILIGLFWLLGTYNGLVKLKNRTDEAWSDIDVQLKRRYDLIPNLVETVKGYAKHEKEVFEQVTEARTRAMGASSATEKADAENQLSNTLKSLFAVSENYPELKASQNFLQLQSEITDTEDKIQAARRFYNGEVRDLNTKIQTFPTNIFAGMLGYSRRDFFGVDNPTERETVKVQF